MVRIASTLALVLLASSASAQVVVTGDRTVQVQGIIDGTGQASTSQYMPGIPDTNGQVVFVPSNTTISNYKNYGNFQTYIHDTSSQVDFANNASAMGQGSFVRVQSTVNVTFTNPSASTVDVKLHSSILPGGMGFYMADQKSNPDYQSQGTVLATSCCGTGYIPTGVINGSINNSPQSTSATLNSWDGASSRLGQVTIDFNVLSGGKSIYDVQETMVLNYSTSGGNSYATFSGTATSLTGWSQTAITNSGGAPIALGAQWSAQELTLDLGDLGSSQSNTLSYVTTVTAESDARNGNQAFDPQMIAYSGFGDPIGKSGSIIPKSLFAALLGASSSGPDISGLNFPQLILDLPTFDPVTGALDFKLTPQTISPDSLTLTTVTPSGTTSTVQQLTPVLSGAPEPSSWALMMLAVGGLGGVLRRRRVAA